MIYNIYRVIKFRASLSKGKLRKAMSLKPLGNDCQAAMFEI